MVDDLQQIINRTRNRFAVNAELQRQLHKGLEAARQRWENRLED